MVKGTGFHTSSRKFPFLCKFHSQKAKIFASSHSHPRQPAFVPTKHNFGAVGRALLLVGCLSLFMRRLLFGQCVNGKWGKWGIFVECLEAVDSGQCMGTIPQQNWNFFVLLNRMVFEWFWFLEAFLCICKKVCKPLLVIPNFYCFYCLGIQK